MYITFTDNRIRRLSEDFETSVSVLGETMAKKLFQRVAEIRAADNLKILRQLVGPNCQPLPGSNVGQYFVDLESKKLVIIPVTEGQEDPESAKDIVISEILNYH